MIQLLIKYLHKTKNSSKLNNFEDAYYSHPNYPSLLSVTDSLMQVKIEHIVANFPFKHIEELPLVFITVLNIESDEYYLVSKKNQEILLENNKGILKKITLNELEKFWTGIILIIEENENNLQKYSFQKTSYLFPVLLLLLAIFTVFSYKYKLIESTFMLLSGIGIFVSIEILKTYFNDTNSGESKFCSANKNFSCKSIINSKSYSFSKYVEFIDLPIIFFSISFFSHILGFNILIYIGILSLTSFPFLVYSIYLQKFVLKKWCFLCLIVSLLITCMGVLYLLTYKNISPNHQHLISLLFLSSLLSIAWFSLKKQLKKSKENFQKLNSLLRFKRNEDVYYKIALPIEDKQLFEALNKISIGNINAKNTLTLFLSPNCPHCHTAYKSAIELIEKYKDQVKLEICYNLNINNLDNPYLSVAKTILQLYNTNKDYKQALEDWHIKNIKLEIWLQKWKSSNHYVIENTQLENQFQWCINNELNYAPIKMFNDFLLPGIYEINELFYFFKE